MRSSVRSRLAPPNKSTYKPPFCNHVPFRTNSIYGCTGHLACFRHALSHHVHHLRHSPTLRFGYELRIDVHGGADPRVPHLGLHRFRLSTRFSHPRPIRAPQHLPIHPADAELARGRLDVSRQDVVVGHRHALTNGLEHEIAWVVGAHEQHDEHYNHPIHPTTFHGPASGCGCRSGAAVATA